MSQHLSWLEAGVIGGMQGVTELFPVSSLGHSVLLPAVIGPRHLLLEGLAADHRREIGRRGVGCFRVLAFKRFGFDRFHCRKLGMRGGGAQQMHESRL